jgi:uncharacterized protein (DUF488 family)
MRVFTVSYEGASLDEFLARLLSAGVGCVVDVREAPISRKKGFSKSALTASLEGVGIGYRHVRELGCPKPVRDRYREDGDWSRYTKAYLSHLAEQGVAVKQLAAQSHREPTALLCYEADFNRCHRTYVARAVVTGDSGQVVHLTREGVVTEAADFAHAAGRSRSRSATGRETGGSSPSAA